MGIRPKIFTVLVSIVIFLSIGIYTSSKLFISSNIEKQDIQESQNTANLAVNILQNEMNSLGQICGDWSSWDDTYRFIEDKNQNFIDVNLVDSTFATLKLNFIIFVNSSDKVAFAKAIDLTNMTLIDFSGIIKSQVLRSSHILNHSSTQSITSGILMYNNTPIMFSSRPITDSNAVKEIKGTLIMGKFIGPEQLILIESFTNARVKMHSNNAISYYASNNYRNISLPGRITAYSRPVSDSLNEVEVIIKDVFNKDAFTLGLEVKRSNYVLGRYGLKVFLISFYTLIFFIFIFAFLMSNKLILSRIKKFNNFVNDIIINKDTNKRIHLRGNDEITNLSNKLNNMLDLINRSKEELIENEKRLTMVMEGSNDGFWDLNFTKKEIYLSSRFMSMLKYGNSEIKQDIKKTLKKYMHPEDLKKLIQYYNHSKKDKLFTFNNEIRVLSGTGEWVWMQAKGKIVEWDKNNNPVRMAGIIFDITERRSYENNIKYLSYHDNLTGLYNRAYYIEELSRLDNRAYLPLSLILGDVNGLKLTNDAFGHKEGDNLLITLSNILKNICKSDGFAARLGGDEFILVLPNTDEKAAEAIYKEIHLQCSQQEREIIRPSISLGCATKYRPEEDIQKLFEIAEDRMYKNKLLEDTSSRHSLIASMERTLLETDYETEEHAKRLQGLSIKLAEYLKLPASAFDELSLLSRLHDIGKIAIPYEILSKEGKLNEAEWQIIKRHPEIGYRIAMSSDDLVPIAESILSHHEKWDGSGYPKGLMKERIPLTARIISIVDAYDVITHARSYKQASTHEEAIEEIKRCSGTHFDPYIANAFIEMFKIN